MTTTIADEADMWCGMTCVWGVGATDKVWIIMAPTILPALDAHGVSGLTGSISICCWIVVFTPQILENVKRKSGDGLSLAFLAIWLAGDLANLIGGIFQQVLPTMLILAVYYTMADVVLILQVYYYRFSKARRASLLQVGEGGWSASHLSPATPLLDPPKPSEEQAMREIAPWKGYLYNTLAIVVVCLIGTVAWVMTPPSTKHSGHQKKVEIDVAGQVFGWLCAALYLGSRLPQLVLNFRRKSCEGVSLLFFLFACIGNVTFCMSILAWSLEKTYLIANMSWLVGAFGTLLLDFVIFAQFFLYT